jgi:hypothetical protein
LIFLLFYDIIYIIKDKRRIKTMAVKGAQAKEQVAQELLNYFGDRAFKYDKEIRVECMENGERVQIKIALTAAKVAVEKDGDVALPGAATVAPIANTPASGTFNQTPAEAPQPTLQEKETASSLLKSLGL